MLDTFTIDTFRQRIGDDFQFAGPEGAPCLRLASARDLRPNAAADSGTERRTPFALLFHAPVGPYLPQATYLIRHDVLGEFPLFLVPLGPRDGHMRYEAIFT